MRKGKIILYGSFWILLFSVILVVFSIQYDKFESYNQEIKALTDQLQQEKDYRLRLEMEREMTGNDAYIEKIARERLGLVMQDEYIFINDSK